MFLCLGLPLFRCKTHRNSGNPFIRVGSWGCYHPPVTPNDIWSMKKVQYRVPMLRIATISMRFASKVGKFYTNDVEVVKEETSEDEININDASHKEGEDVNEEVKKKHLCIVIYFSIWS